jgi:GNAT superfamily N-acetyltransferase
MGFDIRQATPDDAPAACALLRRSIEHGCAADHAERPEILQAWLSNKTPHTVATWFGSQTNYAVVAQGATQGANELVGLALVNQAGRLALCYVDPAWLRHGVGTALLEAIEAQARAWNISKLHMHSPASAPFSSASVTSTRARTAPASAWSATSCGNRSMRPRRRRASASATAANNVANVANVAFVVRNIT